MKTAKPSSSSVVVRPHRDLLDRLETASKLYKFLAPLFADCAKEIDRLRQLDAARAEAEKREAVWKAKRDLIQTWNADLIADRARLKEAIERTLFCGPNAEMCEHCRRELEQALADVRPRWTPSHARTAVRGIEGHEHECPECGALCRCLGDEREGECGHECPPVVRGT